MTNIMFFSQIPSNRTSKKAIFRRSCTGFRGLWLWCTDWFFNLFLFWRGRRRRLFSWSSTSIRHWRTVIFKLWNIFLFFNSDSNNLYEITNSIIFPWSKHSLKGKEVWTYTCKKASSRQNQYLTNFNFFWPISFYYLGKITFLHTFHLNSCFILLVSNKRKMSNFPDGQCKTREWQTRGWNSTNNQNEKPTVSTSQSTSPGDILSPSFFNHRAILPCIAEKNHLTGNKKWACHIFVVA